MIEIQIYSDQQDRIRRMRISGHALFRQAGSDIVCAAVSVLAINAVNSSEALLGLKVPAEMDERAGMLDCTLPNDLVPETEQSIQLLFRSAVFGFGQISEQYPGHVRLTQFRI